jgi:hypothetical protein
MSQSASSLASIGRQVFQLGYEISPIILSGESQVSQLIPGGFLPIIALTEGINFVRGLLQGVENIQLNDFFAHFTPMPGSTLIDNQIGMYPFANQAVAANAIITQPKSISLRMDCPARGEGAYLTKLATLTALRATLELHNTTGGTYIVATPGQIYTNCVMTGLRDVSSTISVGGTKQVQVSWQFDFVQPLLTLSQAEGAQSSLMSKITAGLQTDGSLSGVASTVGAQLSGALSSIMPAAQSIIGSAIPIPTSVAPLLPVTQVPL